VNKIKNPMKERKIDVEVVDLPSILESTKYNRELFLIQGYARRREKMRKEKHGLPDDSFLSTKFYLKWGLVDTSTMLYAAKMAA
jgi:hypothetical protein